MKPTLTYVIAEDHSLVREGLISKINTDAPHATLVAEASNGKELLDSIKQLKQLPDIAIIDLGMPVLDGAETAKQLVTLYPTIKILMISVYTDENSLVNLFNIGVHGFISKENGQDNFARAFDELLTEGFLNNPYYKRAKLENLNWKKFGFIGNVRFTHQEIKFLKLKLTNLSLKEIAKEMHVAEKTAENYRDAAYEKLNVKSRAELVTKLIQMGFIKEDPTNP